QDARVAHPAYVRSYGAATSKQAWQTANPTTAASTNSGCSDPTAASTQHSRPARQRSQPATARSAQPAARPEQQAPHRTDADHQTPQHDRQTRRTINSPRRQAPDQLHQTNVPKSFTGHGNLILASSSPLRRQGPAHEHAQRTSLTLPASKPIAK